MNKNRIITYSLLSYLNENKVGFTDLNDIFLPILKMVLSRMNSEGFNSGHLSDIKEKVDSTFALDIPFPLLKKMINRIAEDINISSKGDFKFYSDGSFVISKYSFLTYEETLLKKEAEIELLSTTYENYLEKNGCNISEEPSIFEFLDLNRISLSRFFAKRQLFNYDTKYHVQASFIQFIKTIPELYSVLIRNYWGSIITSYLEVDFGKPNTNRVEYLLDTNFIVNLIGLCSPEREHTCNKVVEICQRLNNRITVLDFTIDETEALLFRQAETFGNGYLENELFSENIYNGCLRKGISSTGLLKIASNIETSLKENFGVTVIPFTTNLRKDAKKSKTYDILKKISDNPDGVWHDLTAMKYVQKKRRKKIKYFLKSNCWFVTNSKPRFGLKIGEFLPETISPEDLLNILWLTSPNVKWDEVVEIGLSRLVSTALNDSLPSIRSIRELDDNIIKYSSESVKAERGGPHRLDSFFYF